MLDEVLAAALPGNRAKSSSIARSASAVINWTTYSRWPNRQADRFRPRRRQSAGGRTTVGRHWPSLLSASRELCGIGQGHRRRMPSTAATLLLVDLGMSSMQVDDAGRGFSYMRDGPLDMRMDRSRGQTAAQLLLTLSHDELAKAFRELGDEPDADKIAAGIVSARTHAPIQTTKQLAKLVREAAPVKVNVHPLPGQPKPWQQKVRPTARVFQALRILVNRELASLQELLRVLPFCLKPGGRAAIISFHSGEDRLVKTAFKEGARSGVYVAVSDDPTRASFEERGINPRSRSAKLRWARRSDPAGPRRTRPALRRPRPVGRVESSRPAIA